MNETVFSILLFVLGLIIGLVSILVINALKKKTSTKLILDNTSNTKRKPEKLSAL